MQHGGDVTICNHRMDTPLHNATRWNHPALVNELLLYGASYSATNNDNKTPQDLTSDEEVFSLILKASDGVIAVGSYSPLKKKHVPRVTRASSLAETVSKEVIARVTSTTVDQRPKSYAGQGRLRSGAFNSKSCGLFGDEAYVMIEEEEVEHRSLSIGSQQGTIEQALASEEQEALGQEGAGLKKAHPKSDDQEEFEHIPRPKRDEKLIRLLQAIEAFDRYCD